MRNRFERQLKKLQDALIEMGALTEEAIDNAAAAIISEEEERAENAIAFDSEVDQKEKEIEKICLELLLRQQPVARDLRLISAALKMITDMERIGDQAADIAEIALLKNAQKVICAREDVAKMAKEAITMVNGCVDAFVKSDLVLANQVIAMDDVVDNMFNTVREDLISEIKSGKTESHAILDMLMVAKYLERIGDHATNIAEWVVFSITGRHPGDKEGEDFDGGEGLLR